jgi:CheY-like chemotaxis protein
MSGRVLVVEDELIGGLYLCEMLSAMGCEVLGPVLSAAEALEAISAGKIDLVLMDVALQGPSSGIEAALAITRNHKIPVIFISAHSDPHTKRRAIASGAVCFHPKPFDPELLKADVLRILVGH